jgi:CheY-like chemotaxis protein
MIRTRDLRVSIFEPYPYSDSCIFKKIGGLLQLGTGGLCYASMNTTQQRDCTTEPNAANLGSINELVSPVRVLVVDDYEPFRRFVCSTLRKRPQIQVVGEASDGLEAVRKAEKLRPDLIVLDIGLPSLNGIEAARRIRSVSPESKILFLSVESSVDVVQEALSLGALGYIRKASAGSELLAAVGAIILGKAFVSGG